MSFDEQAIEKLGAANEKINEAIGRAILVRDSALSMLLLESGELVDAAINDLNTIGAPVDPQ